MASMRAVVPDPWIPNSCVVQTGNDDGVPSEISVEVPRPNGQQPFTVRTMVRLGERIGPGGRPHGTMTDSISVATQAGVALRLQAMPAGLPRADARSVIDVAEAESRALAQERGGWAFSPVVLDTISYALWYRPHPLGFIAHADLGDRVIAAWGAGDLPEAMGRLQLVDAQVSEFSNRLLEK